MNKNRSEKIEKKLKSEKTCFVISPISVSGSATRERSDQLLKHIIEPVCKSLGFKTIRADKLKDPGVINNQIIELLIDAELVIADLTEKNPNVFYELGVRHCAGKPFIHLIHEKHDLPFDVAGVRATVYELTVDKVKECKVELKKQIEWLEEHQDSVVNPVTLARSNFQLSSKGSAIENNLGQILGMLHLLATDMDTVRSDISSIESETSDIWSIKSQLNDIESKLD